MRMRISWFSISTLVAARASADLKSDSEGSRLPKRGAATQPEPGHLQGVEIENQDVRMRMSFASSGVETT